MTVSRPERIRFGTLSVRYNDQVLQPREWTAAQSLWARELLSGGPDGPVLELCAGVGHIGLLAVAEDPDRELVLVDLNPAACELARENAAEAGRAASTRIRQGRLEDVVGAGERYVGVIADPPWVPSDETGRFPEDPLIAIDGGTDGLDLAWACVQVAQAHVIDTGWVLLQLGSLEQVSALEKRLADAGSGVRVEETRRFERGVVALLRPLSRSAQP